MTTAERTRRHRLKHGNPHRGTHSPVPPEPSVCERCAGLAAKLDAARSRVAELEGQLRSAPLPDARVAELEEELSKSRRGCAISTPRQSAPGGLNVGGRLAAS